MSSFHRFVANRKSFSDWRPWDLCSWIRNRFSRLCDYLSIRCPMYAVKWEREGTNYSLSFNSFFFLTKIIYLITMEVQKCCQTSWKKPHACRRIFLKSTKFGRRQSLAKERESQYPGPEDGYTSPLWPVHCAWVVWLWYPNCQHILRGNIDPWTWHSHSCASAEWHCFDLAGLAFHKCQWLFRFVLTCSLRPLGNFSLLISCH